jgi:cell division protein FtsQ
MLSLSKKWLSENVILLRKFGVLLVITAMIWQLSAWLNNPTMLPIKNVRIESAFSHVSKQKLSEALSTHVDTGYFAMDVAAVVNAAESLAWVKKASVRRVWPDSMVISIVEQSIAAKWNDKSFLNQEGEIFSPIKIEVLTEVPQLYGANHQSHLVLEKLNALNASISSEALLVSVLAKAEHGSWTVKLKNGTEILMGKRDPLEAIKIGVQVLALASDEVLQKIEVLDVRYPNGLSIIWKKGRKPEGVMLGGNVHQRNQNGSKEG